MKNLIISALLTLPLTVQADTTPLEECKDISYAAGEVMKVRQNGGEMAVIYELTNGNKMFEVMVIEAYKQTMYTTEEYKNRAVVKYKNLWFGECIKARSN
jgi:predicted outer membrane protein